MSNKTLEDSLADWLIEKGFALEMETATAFRHAGFDVRQSSVILDRQESKAREIDVLAEDPDFIGTLEIYCLAECKSSTKYPWVVFIADDTLQNFSPVHAFAMVSPAAREAMLKAYQNNVPAIKGLLTNPKKVGYAFRQGHTDKDIAYTAAMGALKACHVIATSVRKDDTNHMKFVFPIIVVDMPLYECIRSADGKLILTEVEQTQFLFSSYIPEHVSCCIRVVRNSALANVTASLKNVANALRSALEELP